MLFKCDGGCGYGYASDCPEDVWGIEKDSEMVKVNSILGL